MRTPTRKPGKYTNLKPDRYITKEKLEELKAKVDKLKNISRPRASAEVKRLALMGDFSENVGYQMAKGRLRGINRRIDEAGDAIKYAKLITKKSDSNIVELGNTITIQSAKKTHIYQILGSSETDPLKGVISHNSPLGSQLLGKSLGDIIKVKTTEYKIVDIK